MRMLSEEEMERWFDGWEEEDLEDSDLPCPRCNSTLKRDPHGGFFLKCTNCGWIGW